MTEKFSSCIRISSSKGYYNLAKLCGRRWRMGGVRQKRPKVKMSGQTVVRQLSGNAQGNTANATTNAAAGMLRNGCVQSAVTRKSKITKRTCLGGPLKDNCFRAVLPSVLSPECPFYLWDKSWLLRLSGRFLKAFRSPTLSESHPRSAG